MLTAVNRPRRPHVRLSTDGVCGNGPCPNVDVLCQWATRTDMVPLSSPQEPCPSVTAQLTVLTARQAPQRRHRPRPQMLLQTLQCRPQLPQRKTQPLQPYQVTFKPIIMSPTDMR